MHRSFIEAFYDEFGLADVMIVCFTEVNIVIFRNTIDNQSVCTN